MDPWSADALLFAGVAFLLAGLVKGTIGLGLPTVALGLLTTTLGLTNAVALMLIPAVVTNAAQAVDIGAGTARAKAMLRRFWPLLLTVAIGVWIGAGTLSRTTSSAPAAMLGLLIALHATISLATPQVPAPGRHERWLSPVVGLINGIITGFTGSSVIPAVLYMQALGLKKDELVQAMGMLFGISTLMLTLAFTRSGMLTADLALLSALVMVPAFLGMWLGQQVRRRVSEERFRRMLFVGLLLLGLYVLARSLG